MQISNLLKLPTPGQINVNVRTMIKTFKKKRKEKNSIESEFMLSIIIRIDYLPFYKEIHSHPINSRFFLTTILRDKWMETRRGQVGKAGRKYNLGPQSEQRSNELIVNYRETGVARITDGTGCRCNSRGTDFRVPLYGT